MARVSLKLNCGSTANWKSRQGLSETREAHPFRKEKGELKKGWLIFRQTQAEKWPNR
jgi:hypothetical protein